MSETSAQTTPTGFRSLMSAIAERMQFATIAGLTFKGARDFYAVLGYQRDLGVADFYARYERGDIAGRIVDAPAQAAWRQPPDVIENDDPETLTAFEQAWDAMADRLRVWSYFTRVDQVASIGRYGVLLIGAPGVLDQPLERLANPDAITHLAVFSEDQAEIDTLVSDPTNPRYGQPEFYRLKLADAAGTSTRAARCHWSRVVHVAAGVLTDDVYGRPVLKRIWNRLDDLDKVIGGGAEAYWLIANRGMQADLDPDVALEPEDEQKLSEEIDEYIHGARRFVRTRGVTLRDLGARTTDPAGLFRSILALISGATGIPQRILMGAEAGQLASTQDRQNWAERVQERRTNFAEPAILRPFVDRLVMLGALPKPATPYLVAWDAIDIIGDVERSEIAERYARATLNLAQAGKFQRVVDPGEAREAWLGLPAELPKEAPAAAPPGATETNPTAALRARPRHLGVVASR